MMKRAVWGSVVVLILVAVLWGVPPEAIAKDGKFPGTYSTARDIVPGLLVARGLATVHDDGTMISTDIAQFGDPAFGGRLTTGQYGVWEKTGPRSLTGTWYFYQADPATGLVNGVVKGTAFFEWDKSGDAGTATFVAVSFPCLGGPLTCPEPADLPPLSAQTPTVSFTFRRLPVY